MWPYTRDMKTYILSALFLSTVFLTSCATSVDASYSARADRYEVKTIYLVNKSVESQQMDDRIRKELQNRKINVIVGPDTNKVTSEDAIMKYTETWKKEITNNIDALDIILFDKNGEIVASSHWKNSKFSTLAPMSTIVSDAIQIIFEKVQIKP